MSVSAIGPYNFVSMSPPPPGKRQMGFVEARAGIRDHAFWREAIRGVPWATITFRDTVDEIDANFVFRGYESLVFAGPQQIIWAGMFPLPSGEILDTVMVLDVRPVAIQRVASSVGGLIPGSRGFVIAEWTLIATEILIEEDQ